MVSRFDAYKHIKVSGEDISTVIKGITATALCRVLLDRYGLQEVQKGKLYPLDSYLQLLTEIERRMPSVLKSIGTLIIEEALFPPNVTTFEQALTVADQGYYMNHQGAEPGEIGHYLFKKESDRFFHMIVDAPYPCIFDEGVISGIARKFDQRISLRHATDECRAKGNSKCDYRIVVAD